MESIVKTNRVSLRSNRSVRNIAKIAMLSAAAFALMAISVPIAVLFPPFLEIDLSDLPALLGGFALGPVAAVVIELIKNILNILVMGTKTGGVGELSNFIVGCAFVVPASLVYAYMKNKKGALIGLIAGTVIMTTIASFSNYFIIIPLYVKLFNMPLEAILTSSPLTVAADMKAFIMIAIVPFNLLKSVILSAAVQLIYKKLSPVLHK